MNVTNMHYVNVLSRFNIEWDAYKEWKEEDYPYVPVINDKYNNSKVIKQVCTFTDCLSQIYGSRMLLVYVLLASISVPSEVYDHLDAESYYETSRSLHEELIARLSQNGPIYNHNNTSVYINV